MHKYKKIETEKRRWWLHKELTRRTMVVYSWFSVTNAVFVSVNSWWCCRLEWSDADDRVLTTERPNVNEYRWQQGCQLFNSIWCLCFRLLVVLFCNTFSLSCAPFMISYQFFLVETTDLFMNSNTKVMSGTHQCSPDKTDMITMSLIMSKKTCCRQKAL